MGDNPERLTTEASFAALCGVSPIEYSLGRRTSRRLTHGGDRQANAALHRIVFTRLRHDPRTQAYYERRTQEGKTRRHRTEFRRGQRAVALALVIGAVVRRRRLAGDAPAGPRRAEGYEVVWHLAAPLYSGSPLSSTRSKDAVTTRVVRPMRSTRHGNSPRRTRS
ncbi:transposase [Streptomyces mirabilis]|uniref:transposase n=1 Tax=Streptomyces mirabilis TaxID=68239 RepID=UPI003625C8B0